MAPSLRQLAVGVCLLTTTCNGALILPGLVKDQTPFMSTTKHQAPLTYDTGSQTHDFYSKRALKIEQNATICDAGSRHWTGHIPLGKGRDMFYCTSSVVTLFATNMPLHRLYHQHASVH